jgi:hypothetical protein
MKIFWNNDLGVGAGVAVVAQLVDAMRYKPAKFAASIPDGVIEEYFK